MKKIYLNPEAKILAVTSQNILTGSLTGGALGTPGEKAESKMPSLDLVLGDDSDIDDEDEE